MSVASSGSTFDSIIHYVPIEEQLATSGQPSEIQLAVIATAGFEVVINLGLHDDRRYALPDEAGTVLALGMQYVHIPVQFAAPSAADLQAFFDALDDAAGRRTLVHCAHNKRVSVFIALHRILRSGWPVDAALEAMQAVWEPDEIWSDFIAAMLAQQDFQPSVRDARA